MSAAFSTSSIAGLEAIFPDSHPLGLNCCASSDEQPYYFKLSTVISGRRITPAMELARSFDEALAAAQHYVSWRK